MCFSVVFSTLDMHRRQYKWMLSWLKLKHREEKKKALGASFATIFAAETGKTVLRPFH